MLHPRLEEAFADLLDAWRPYDDERVRSGELSVRAAARRRLDEARARVWRLRRALHPEPWELEEAATAAFCPELGVDVLLFRRDGLAAGGAGYFCACGSAVAMPPVRRDPAASMD